MHKRSFDELDNALIERARTFDCRSVRDLIRPFLKVRSETALRMRARDLELWNKIHIVPGSGIICLEK